PSETDVHRISHFTNRQSPAGRMLFLTLAAILPLGMLLVSLMHYRNNITPTTVMASDASSEKYAFQSQNSKEPERATPPIKIKSLTVTHSELIRPDETRDKGNIGEVSFAVKQGDRASIFAKLSHPGYAYLLAFAPDGTVEVCWPQNEATPPPLSEDVHFPVPGNRGRRYAFTDGTGLVIFTLIASSQPLPAYQEWSKGLTWNWKPSPGVLGQVWIDDGKQIEILTPLPAPGYLRGKDEKSLSPTAVMELLNDALLKQRPIESLRSIAFVVH
ncbi:MAG TPA: hypothetical protein PKA06_08005, partial [Gemmatales bacterium]|nr:hypothetical protein [Gemmatales bacterium]